MKAVVKILIYFVAVVVLGAILAPPLFWGGQVLARAGIVPALAKVEFQKFFNRAVLVAAIGLIWPTARCLQIGSWRELGLQPDPKWWRHWLVGFAIAALVLVVMSGSYIAIGIYRWKNVLPWAKLLPIALSAIVVACIEEGLFRGAIFGIFRRTLRPIPSLFWVSAIFAAVHFLKPDDDLIITDVRWYSGFQLLAHVFEPFTEPIMLLAGFSTLFTLGWVLGYATLRTRSLWMAIGLHSGVVLMKMGFAKLTKVNREELYLPWVGSELQIGLVPVGMLLVALFLVWLWCRYVDHSTDSTNR